MKNTKVATFAQRLAEALKIREVSQTELHERTGINKSSISTYLKGEYEARQNKVYEIARALNVSEPWLMGYDVPMSRSAASHRHGVKIPVLGHVVAGYPIEAVENVIGEEEISEEMARSGDYFALIVNGQSMTPTLNDGDTVIIQKTPIAHSGQIAVVMVNGDEATLKEIKLEEDGLWLIGHNSTVYPPKFYTAHEVEMLPVTICGVLVELRRSFN